MNRHILVVFVVLTLSSDRAFCAVDAGKESQDRREVALSSLKLDYSKLKSWGTTKFSYEVERRGKRMTVGTVTMKTSLSGKGLHIDDSWAVKFQGKDVRWQVKLRCRLTPMLRPESVASVGRGDDEAGTFTLNVGKEKAVVVKGESGRKTKVDYPADTVTDVSLFRLFALLPRETGVSYTFAHFMEVSELNLKGAGFIRYLGQKTIDASGKQIPLHKFEYRRGDPSSNDSIRVVAEAWLDDEGRLRKARLDGRKVLSEVSDRQQR